MTVRSRLTAQQLSGPKARSPENVVARLLAVQAQDPRGARLAVRARSSGLRAADVDEAMTVRRSLVISWLGRGTLHLVAADDYWWLHALTTPQLATGNARRLEQEGVSRAQADRGVDVVVDALRTEGPQTRTQLRERLDDAGVPTGRQALVHVLLAASLRGHVVRGPMVGGEQAFVWAPDWLGPPHAPLDLDEALARLARRYLAGHGPADPRDLAGWAGVPLGQARRGLDAISLDVVPAGDADGPLVDLVDLADRDQARPVPAARLLGPFDPLLHGWRSRGPIVGEHHSVVTSNGVFRPVALVGGRVVATWGLADGTVTIRPLEPVPDRPLDALRKDAGGVLQFFDLPRRAGRRVARPPAAGHCSGPQLGGTLLVMSDRAPVDRERVAALQKDESARFEAEHPRSMDLRDRARSSMPRGVPMSWMETLYEHPPVFVEAGEGSRFTDVDGNSYLDMYIGDMSGFCGHAPPSVVAAVTQRMARGNHFLQPGEDAIVVAEHLAARYRLPKWQFTLSATQANAEVIRIARHITGREIVLLFDGKYHGHGDATLVVVEEGRQLPEYQGLPSAISGQARVIAFNDIAALEAALAPRDVALVLTEPVMTNAGIINPEPGFHEALRQVTRDIGTLLALDETHSLVGAYAGMSGEFGLAPDLLTIGKSIAAGVPLGAYGMTDEVAALASVSDAHNLVAGAIVAEVATGGTLFANALSMAAARAALTEVLTPSAFQRARGLGARMADGLEAAITTAGLPWNVSRMGTHAYYGFAPEPARNGAESRANDDVDLRALIRVWMANRGVWESGWWLGPTVSVAHTDADVDEYVGRFGEFLAALV